MCFGKCVKYDNDVKGLNRSSSFLVNGHTQKGSRSNRNLKSLLQLAVLNKPSIPIWQYHQYKTRSTIVLAIKDMIYKGIKAFVDVGDINKHITTIQPVWS